MRFTWLTMVGVNCLGGLGCDSAATPAGPGRGATSGPYFDAAQFFNLDVSGLAKASSSDAMIAALAAAGGWGNRNEFLIDNAFDVLEADAAAPVRAFVKNEEFYYPDCDFEPVPVPAGGAVEDNPGYACANQGDCHLLVHAPGSRKLFEMYYASIEGATFRGGCLAVWDTAKPYGTDLRGRNCAGADASGMPMAPMLLTPDEVAAGEVRHALRFTLPASRLQKGYVPPATHSPASTGGTQLPAFGANFRLRANFPLASLPSEGARVVARALMRYGMYVADHGETVLSGQRDTRFATKWQGLLDPHDLKTLRVSDFEIVEHGAMRPYSQDCMR